MTTPKRRKLITGFDTETTGVEDEDRIIEFGALIMDIDTGAFVYKFESRFNSGGRMIAPRAEEVHGISMSEIAMCPDFSTAIDSLNKIAVVSPIWLAHNAEFDIKRLAYEYHIAGRTLPDITLLDSMDARWATPNGKNPSLQELCFSVGVDYDPNKAHAALYDVAVMLQAWHAGYKRGFFTYPEAA